MTVLVLGATGKTGRWVVRHLLEKKVNVKVIVRSEERFRSMIQGNEELLTVIEDSILDMPMASLSTHLQSCDGVISCLGHNITLKGIFGPPYRLVTKAVEKVCQSALSRQQDDSKFKVVLMNTTGNRNKDLNEKVSMGHKIVVGIIRTLVPPQRDNESAADYLSVKIGQKNEKIAWVAVRPDGLFDDDQVQNYTIHPSPLRDPIFDAGKTSRINAAHFMAELMTAEDLWNKWVGQMPVVYNSIGF